MLYQVSVNTAEGLKLELESTILTDLAIRTLSGINLNRAVVVSESGRAVLHGPDQAAKFIIRRDDGFHHHLTVAKGDAPPARYEFGRDHKTGYQTCMQRADIAN